MNSKTGEAGGRIQQCLGPNGSLHEAARCSSCETGAQANNHKKVHLPNPLLLPEAQTKVQIIIVIIKQKSACPLLFNHLTCQSVPAAWF